MLLDLTNQFLIAMPTLDDPNFARTVTYVCAHNEGGAMGIVINRPLKLELGEVLSQMQLETADPAVNAQIVYQGGPVHRDRGFIIHRPALDGEVVAANGGAWVDGIKDVLVMRRS